MKLHSISIAAVALLALWTAPAFAGVSSKEMDRFERSGQVLQDMIDAPDKGIPKGMLDHARCVAVVPSLKKGAFGFGGRFGYGFVTCRRNMKGSWGPVSSFKIAGGNAGFHIGSESVDVVLLFVHPRGTQKLLADQFSLGGDTPVSAGPLGGTASSARSIALHSEIYAYARSRGSFTDIALDGARMYQDGEVNRDLYGREIKAADILVNPKVAMPDGAAHMIGVLNKYSPRARTVKK
jgi:lipid-binding SYLF domain-containing protein